MLGAITIGDITEAQEIIKRLSRGTDDGCAVLEKMNMIDFEVWCNLLLPEHHLGLAWKQISRMAVVQIPKEITTALAQLTDEQRAALAHQWSQSEEFLDLVEEEYINEFLVESIKLAKESCTENKLLLFINI